MDPAITGLISWIAGIESFPSIEIWIGFFVTIFGIGMVTYGEKMRDSNQVSTGKHVDDEDASL